MSEQGVGRPGRTLVMMLVGVAWLVLACGGDAPASESAVGPVGETAPSSPVVDDDRTAQPAAATGATATATPGDDTVPGDDTAPDDAGSGATDLDAEPLASDPTGDVPAGPPGPERESGSPDGETVPGAESGPEPDPAGGTADRPEPTIDTDSSPDSGEVPNGVSGDTEVRDTLSYPTTEVVALGRGTTTDLATELAGSDRPTLLWFWTPDCPTCGPESAAVARFADTYRGTVRVLGLGAGGSRADADSFAAASSVDESLLVWAQDRSVHAHYNITATPFAIMVAPNGAVMAQWRGMVPELFAFAERL